jgi:hypothetical protein
MVSAYAARLRLTLAPDTVPVAADNGGELEAAIEVLGLIALKGTQKLGLGRDRAARGAGERCRIDVDPDCNE